MAFSEDDLKTLAGFVGGIVKDEVAAAVSGMKAELPAAVEQNRTAIVGAPDVDPEAGPLFWLHLADGSVVESRDSSSTHLANDAGESVPVIGRYQKGA